MNLPPFIAALRATLARRFRTAPPPPIPASPPTVEELSRYLLLSVKHRHTIRPAKEFVPRETTRRQQIIDLIDHLYVRYPVPLFLYRTMLSAEGLRVVFGTTHPLADDSRLRREATYRRWFRAVAWGEPFATLVKDRLSRREAHWFLRAPARNEVEKNVEWARVAALGVPPDRCELFLQQFGYLRIAPERLGDLARFYVRAWDEFEPGERREIVDFVRSTFDDPGFSFAGRTSSSVRALSAAWHQAFRDAFLASPTPVSLSWMGICDPWETRDASAVVRAVELTSGAGLAEESAHQGHCVASYARRCHAGGSRIVSLRWFDPAGERETARLTVEIEIAAMAVVQIRGRHNRRATPKERSTIRLWTEAQGLRLAEAA